MIVSQSKVTWAKHPVSASNSKAGKSEELQDLGWFIGQF